MKNIFLKAMFRLLYSVLILIFHAYTLSAQSSGDNFTISTNNIYFPGEDISLNVSSYDYADKGLNKAVMFSIDVYRIRDISGFYSKQSSKYGLDVLSKDSMNLISLADFIYSVKKNIKSKKEYNYNYFSESIPLNINSGGAYLVKVTSGNKVAYCGFIISSIGLVAKAGNSSMLAYVVNRKTGEPVSGAELDFFTGTEKTGHGVTEMGLFYQELKYRENNLKDEDMNPLITGKYNDEVVVSDPYLYFGYSGNKYYTYIFTEQTVYRTNSDVNFKGTIRRNFNSKLEPLSDKNLTVTIKDSKGAEVYRQNLTTNKNGSFDGTYKIDENQSLGNYSIIASIDENNSYTAVFTVEQYKKPEYKVTVKADKGQYYGKDNLKAVIEAKYFFGSVVKDADVEYNIYKVRYYKPWWKFSEYAWWYEDYLNEQDNNQKFSGAEFIFSGNAKLDGNGKAEVEYSINEEFKDNTEYYDWYRPYYMDSDYKYIIQAKVTDKSRREISGTAEVFVTRGGFYLNAKTDKYLYKPGDNVNIEVIANDFSDKPVQTEFEATIYRTTWSGNDYRENKDFVNSLIGKTSSDGKGIISLNPDDTKEAGSYFVEIKAKDEKANVITAGTYFYVSDGDMRWYYNQSGGAQIITDKDSYKPGEVCKALIMVTNPDANVLVTSNTDDILFYKVEKFTGTSAIIEIPVTDKYTSNFQININYVYKGNFINSEKNVLVIPEKKFLTVLIDPSKLIYKPGEEGELKVKVTDYSGNPVSNAEVALGIVDESIYSIKEDNTKDIRKFFYGNKNVNVSTAYNSNNTSTGYSRLITIYEKFNLSFLSEKDLATVKGRLLKTNGNPVQNGVIVINEDYQAAVTDFDGNFEFKLPEGKYVISAYIKGITKDDLKEIRLYKGQIKTITLYTDREMNEVFEEQNGMAMDRVGENNNETRAAPMMKSSKMKGVFKMNDEGGSDEDNIRGDNYKEAEVRSDFRDAIYWSPYTMTDENGYASVNVKYPDNLTEWRITSRVITEDTKAGQMTSSVITRKDLIIRMETPRFFQDKDEITVSTVIHNYLKTEKKTKVKFSGENVSLIENSGEKIISIAPDSDIRVDWKIKVNEPVGEAKLFAEALTDEESDAVELKVPVQPRGLKINLNAVADFSDEIKTETKNITVPEGTDLRSTEMNFTVDASLASTVLTSLDELTGYPYGCVEQTMSRFLPTITVANIFKELNVTLSDETKANLPKMVDKGLKRLYSFQHSDGGWGWWENDNTNPYMTAYVIYGLIISKNSGYEINESIMKRGINSIISQLEKSDIDATTRAFMIYTLSLTENRDLKIIKSNIEKLNNSEINDYTRSLIAMTWKLNREDSKASEESDKLLKNAKTAGDGTAFWEGKEFHYRWQDDKVQTTASVLKAIIMINNKSDIKEKIVRWLMMQRMGTSWRSTQETATVIYGLVDYLKYSNELNPDYNVKVYVNGQNVFEKQMTSSDVYLKSKQIKVKDDLIKTGNNEIKIEKSGKGKVYFSSGVSYYKSDEKISADESGFRVEREYFKLEKYYAYNDDKITYRKKYFDGTVNSGDEVLVKLKVYSKENNQYFMLEDPLPAGTEVVKDDWSFSIEDENNYRSYPYYYWRWWYSDKEVRDNRVTFFATYIGVGEYEFSYIIHTQIPGNYNVNPAKGMLMYYPEYFGSTQNSNIRITEQ
jgi:uncharacterized protein YfaS (alpha-2-macroglobulin family)